MKNDTERLAALADAVLELAAKIDPRSPGARDVVPLTGTEVIVIRQIHREPRITPSRLAEVTGLQRSNISTAIRSLEARELITRRHPPGDGRTVELIATELGAENLNRLHGFWAERLGQARPEDLAIALDAVASLRSISEQLG